MHSELLTSMHCRADSLKLNPRIVAKAMLDGENGKPEMSDEIARGFIMSFVTARQAVQAEKQAEQDKLLYKDYIAENEAFLAKNKEKTGVTVTPSGLQYEVIKMGTGNKPTANSTVKVHYVGTLIDGTEFDSSVRKVNLLNSLFQELSPAGLKLFSLCLLVQSSNYSFLRTWHMVQARPENLSNLFQHLFLKLNFLI